ncbi:MAG: cupin domain-containing protein [Planctomycetota bacterium]
MARRSISGLLGTALLIVALATSGCLTRRQKALVERRPRNRVFRPDEVSLAKTENHTFEQFDHGGSQDLVVLQLAPDARLRKRYHAEHDLTLFIARGSAIVQVEETRYFVRPGGAVILPRYTAYSVTPHRTEKTVKVVMVFSPPYDPDDVELVD